jgi:hypothetical protein
VIGNVERVLAGMIGGRPIAARVVEADENPVLVLFHHRIPVDVRAPSLDVDIREMEFRHVEGKWRGPEELAAGSVERPYAARLSYADHDVALFPARDFRIDPLHRAGIRVERGAHERALVDMVEVPVVARQMLVVPDELAGFDIKRER